MINIQTDSIKILSDLTTPVSMFLKLREHFPEILLLESSDYSSKEDSLSFICFEPLLTLQYTDKQYNLKNHVENKMYKSIANDAVKAVEVMLHSIQLCNHNNTRFNVIFGYTAFYMVQEFKVNSVDYLLKPVNYDELVQAIEKFKSLKKQFAQPNLETLLKSLGHKEPEYKSRFMITVGTRIRSIETTEIAYFYSEEKLTFMVTKEGQNLPIDFSLDKLTSMLNPHDVFRISRQFLVSFQSIQIVHSHIKGKLKLEPMPKTKFEVLVSGDRMTDFKEWLGR